MKHKITISTIILLFVCSIISPLTVNAGSVTLSFQGNDTVRVNDNITLTVRASDINGLTNGLATAQGDVAFDEGYLEYSGYKALSSTLSVSYGTKTKRFVALGLGGEYISSDDNLFSLTFKAKQIGDTKLNINNVVIGDTKAIIHSSNVLEKTVHIVGDQEKTDDNTSSNTTDNNKGNTNKNNNKGNTNKNNSNSNTNKGTSSKSSTNTLSSLIVNNSKMSPSFSKDTTSYNVVVPNGTSKLDIVYTVSDKKSKVSISGNSNLKDGSDNTVIVTVEAEDGSKKSYTLHVTFDKESSDNKLKSLDIKESKIDFDQDKYEYNIKVSDKVKKLTIDAIAKDKDSKIEIIGNNKLSKGNNVVLIKLTNKEGFSTYYKVNVKKDNEVKLFGINVKYIIFGLLLLLLLIIIILFIILKRKKDDDDDNENDKNDKNDRDSLHRTIVAATDDDDDDQEDDLYDDIVTKNELINAIEEKNPKKLKMLLTQEKVNKLKDELREEERNKESE